MVNASESFDSNPPVRDILFSDDQFIRSQPAKVDTECSVVEHYNQTIKPRLVRDKQNGLLRQHTFSCCCRIHCLPPSVREAELVPGNNNRLGYVLSRFPSSGPVYEAAWRISRDCRRSVSANRRDALLVEQMVEGSFRSAMLMDKLPKKILALADEEDHLLPSFMPDGCYLGSIRTKFQHRVLNICSYRARVSDWILAMEVCGRNKMPTCSILRVESNVYHLSVVTNTPSTRENAMALYRQAIEIANGAPEARIGFRFSRGGNVMGVPEKLVQRQQQIHRWTVSPLPSPNVVTERKVTCEEEQAQSLNVVGLEEFVRGKNELERSYYLKRADRRKQQRFKLKNLENGLYRVKRIMAAEHKAALMTKVIPLDYKARNRFGCLDQVIFSFGGSPPTSQNAKVPSRRREWNILHRCTIVQQKAKSERIQSDNIKRKLHFLNLSKMTAPKVKRTFAPVSFDKSLDTTLAYFASFCLPGGSVRRFKSIIRTVALNVICPKNYGYELNVVNDRYSDKIKSVSFKMLTTPGISVRSNGIELAHFAGRTPIDIKKIEELVTWWRRVTALRKAQKEHPDRKGKGKEIIESFSVGIFAKFPSLYRSFMGFKIGAWIGRHPIYSYSGKYSVAYESNPNETFSIMNKSKLKGIKDSDIRFTALGLARMWIDLGNRKDWKFTMARTMKTTVHALNMEMESVYKNSPPGPDMIIEGLHESSFAARNKKIKIITEEVVVSIPSDPLKKTNEAKVKFEPKMIKSKLMFGDIVTSIDWNMLAQAGDVNPNPGPTPGVYINPATPNSAEPASAWMASFYSDATTVVSPQEALEAAITDYKIDHKDEPLPYEPIEIDDVFAVNRHQALLLGYPTFTEKDKPFIRLARKRRRRLSAIGSFVSGFLDTESREHTRSNEPWNFVIEKNPGPPVTPSTASVESSSEQRGRPTHTRSKSEGDNLKIDTKVSENRSPSPNPSMVRRVMTKLHLTEDDLITLRRTLGFSGNNQSVVEQIDLPDGNDLKFYYQKHMVIGHLPSDRVYRKGWSVPFVRRWFEKEDQYILDTNFAGTPHFQLRDSAHLQALVNSFFQQNQTCILDRKTVASLANNIKSVYKCPTLEWGFALELSMDGSREVVLHWTENPEPEVAGKIWYYVQDDKFFHGGTEWVESAMSGFTISSSDETVDINLDKPFLKSTEQISATELSSLQCMLDELPTEARPLSVEHHKSFQYFLFGWSAVNENCELSAPVLTEFTRELKLSFNCPDRGSYGLFIKTGELTARLTKFSRCNGETRDRLWVVVDGQRLVHLGVTDDEAQHEVALPAPHRTDLIVSANLPDYLVQEYHFQVIEGISQCQTDLDKALSRSVSYDESVMNKILDILEDHVVGGSIPLMIPDLYTLAYILKTECGCPSEGSYSIQISSTNLKVDVVKHAYDTEESAARCWLVVDGVPMLHLGDPIVQAIRRSGRPSLRTAYHLATQFHDQFVTFDQLEDAMEENFENNNIPGFVGGELQVRICLHMAGVVVKLFMTVYYFIRLWLNMFSEHTRPNMEPPSSHSRGDDDDDDNDNDDHGDGEDSSDPDKLIIVTMGTKGDTTPTKLLGAVARSYGIPVSEVNQRTMNGAAMEDLRKGKVWDFLPDYAGLTVNDFLGCKAMLVPHVDIPFSQGLSYTLSPSSHYINPIKFVDSWEDVSAIDYVPAKIMEFMHQVFTPAINIGSLRRGSNFPRTVNGWDYLQKKPNLDVNRERIGWTSGSNNPEVIPEEVRYWCEEIPPGDHSELFRNYHKVYIHGGAGTVQTAIACGCEYVVCDPTMDRNYHNPPSGKDFYVPNISTLMGYLVLRGFKISVPIEVKIFWVLGFLWNTKKWLMFQFLDLLSRVMAFALCAWSVWPIIAALYFAIPLMIWRLLLARKTITESIWMSIGFLWEFPFLSLQPSCWSLGMSLWMIRRWYPRILSDIHAMFRPRFYLEFEPAKHKHGYFPIPFGHYSIWDSETETRYEGQFIAGKGHTIGAPFRFTKSKRKVKSWTGCFRFPVPFNLLLANSLAAEQHTNEYSASYNCLTLSRKLVSNRSVLWTVILWVLDCAVWLALQPPHVLNKIAKVVGVDDIENSAFYGTLGFAAGIENIPLTIADEIEVEEELSGPEEPIEMIDDEDSPLPDPRTRTFPELVEDTIKIVNWYSQPGHILEDYSDKEKQTIVEESVMSQIDNMPMYDEDKILLELPGYKTRKSFNKIVSNLHHAVSFMRHDRTIDAFIVWLGGVKHQIVKFIKPILDMLTIILQHAYEFSVEHFRTLFIAGSDLISYAYGLEPSKRFKTVWGLTGIHKTGPLSIKAKIALNAAHATFVGRSNNPLKDLDNMVHEINKVAERLGVGDPKRVGGHQFRKVNLRNQLMTRREGDGIGWKPEEYRTNPEFEKMVQRKIDEGAEQATDGVRFASRHPDKISKSINRYQPKYPALSGDMTNLANLVGISLFDDYYNILSNLEITPPKSVFKYLEPKDKYSPGIPFLGPNGFKTRGEYKKMGYLKVVEEMCLDKIFTGKIPVQEYHDFLKAQAVPLEAMRDPHPAYPKRKGKDPRTVTAQDPVSYTIAQVVSMERNKRSWDDMGIGTGMRLNQTMGKYFEDLEEFAESLGGGYLVADAKAFDSTEGPFCTRVNSILAELGFKDHWSGNGDNLASIMSASFDAQASAWNIAITKSPHSCVTIACEDAAVKASLAKLLPDNTLDTTDLTSDDIIAKIENGDTLGRILLTNGVDDPKLPKDQHFLGYYRVGDPAILERDGADYQTFVYEDRAKIRPSVGALAIPRAMVADILVLAEAPIAQVSSFHAKNRGGATGKWDTTIYNTLSIHGVLRGAWSLMFNRPPSEFKKYVKVKATGDDMMIASGGKYGWNSLEDVMKFKKIVASFGIHLEVDWTKNITEVDYLSKVVRRPTAQDSEDLQVWRKIKISQAVHRAKQLGFDTTNLDTSLFNNPRWLVVQQLEHLKMRGTALRYYQASPRTFNDVVAKRAAGHALNTAFEVEAWQHFADEWTYSVNRLCEQNHIHQKFVVNMSRGPNHLPRIEQVDPRAKTQALSPRQKDFLKNLKAMMYPSYLKVLEVHMNTAEMDPDKHDKLFGKLERSWRGPHEVVSELVDYLYTLTDKIPDDYRKFTPGPAVQYAERSFYTQNKICERFVWQSLLKHHDWDDITYGIFVDACNKGPYACAMDPYGFYSKIQNPDYRKEVEEENQWMVQGMVFWITVIYAMTPYLENIILALWFFGPLYKIWMWSFFGLSKVYGLLNTLYWHAEGTSSAEISRQMPKDPYVVSKRFCVFVADLLPEYMGLMMLLPVGICKLIPEALEGVSKINFMGTELKQIPKGNNPQENPWSRYSDEIIDAVREENLKTAVLSAAPATGKTSYNIAALYAARHAKQLRHIVVVSPTLALRNQVSLPFGIKVKVIEKGIEWTDSDTVLSCTYGHFFQSVRSKLNNSDIAIFDEFHKQTEPMIAALDRGNLYGTLLMSATPAKVEGLEDMKVIRPDIQPRFKNQIRKCPNDMPVIDMFQLAWRENPSEFNVAQPRVLIVVPTIKQQTNLIEQLSYLLPNGTKISRFSRHNKSLPDQGIIVSTQYIDAGTDIKGEYPSIMIDCGKRVLIDRNKFVHPLPWTDFDTNKQRVHRVGRNKPGVVYQPELAGTGPKGVEYTAPSYMQYKHVARHFRVNMLGRSPRPACTALPWVEFNPDLGLNVKQQKSVAILHSFCYAGLETGQWEAMYGRIQNNFALGSEYDYILRTVQDWRWSKSNILSWDKALDLYNTECVAFTHFESWSGDKWKRPGRPFKLIGHLWDQLDPFIGVDSQVTGHDLTMDPPGQWADIAEKLNNVRSGLLAYVSEMSPAMKSHVQTALFPTNNT